MNRTRALARTEGAGFQQSNIAQLDSLQEMLDELRARLLARPNDVHTDEAMLAQVAREIVRLRRRRAIVFEGDDLFGEPAWDILLELYAATEEQHRLSVSGACAVSGVPATTALRWIERLEKEGWVHRTPDPLDRRRYWVQLTERATNAIRTSLTAFGLGPK